MSGLSQISINLEGQDITNQLYLTYVFTPCCGGITIRMRPQTNISLQQGVYLYDEDFVYDGLTTGLVAGSCYTLTHEFISDLEQYNNLPFLPVLENDNTGQTLFSTLVESCNVDKCQNCDNYPNAGTFLIQSCCDENFEFQFHIYQYPQEEFPLFQGYTFEYNGDVIPKGCYTIVRQSGQYLEAVFPFLDLNDFITQSNCETSACVAYCPPSTCYEFTNCQTSESFIGTINNEENFTGNGTYNLSFSSGSTITVQGLELGLGFSLDSDDSSGVSYTVTALPTGEIYNTKPVYKVELQGNEYYILWNNILTRWEFWDNYSFQTGPVCSNCCGINVPWLYIEASDPITSLGVWATTPNGCDNFNPVKGIRTSQFVDVNVPLSTQTSCWNVVEKAGCFKNICVYIYYRYLQTPPVEITGEIVATEYIYNNQPVYFLETGDLPIDFYIVFTGSVWQVWSGFDEMTGPFCNPVNINACCEESPGVFLPYFESQNLLNGDWTNLCMFLPESGGNPQESEFIFQTTDCGTSQEPLEVTIVEKYESCEECFGNCYKLVDCLTGEVLWYQGIYLSAYVGKTIKINRVFPDGYIKVSCFTVEEGVCQPGATEFPFEVLDCFTECEDCLPKCYCSSVINSGTVSKKLAYTDCEGNRVFTNEFVPAGKRSKKYCVLSWDDADAFDEYNFGECVDGNCPETPQPKKLVTPGYNTPACTPEQYEKIVCNYAEQAYKLVLTERYGIADCCPDERKKWEIKYEQIQLEAITDPDYECQSYSDCGCGYIDGRIHTYTCPPVIEPEPEPQPEPNPLPCTDCILLSFIPIGLTEAIELYVPPFDTYPNGTNYYSFSYAGIDYEIYNETYNTPGDAPGGWYLYSYDGSGDIGYNSIIGECPAGIYVIDTPGYFTSFEVNLCGETVTEFVLYSVYIDGGGNDASFTYPDCNGDPQTLNFPAARFGYTVFVCSTKGQSSEFIASVSGGGNIEFTVTETTANCNC